MTYQWQTPTEETTSYNSHSDVSLLTPFRPKHRPPTVVPAGTVASRIRELQELATNSGYNKHLSPNTARFEQGRTSYGRRTAYRFGKPATRSSRPDDSETQHSFLALRSYRASHMQEHALADEATPWVRSNGFRSQLQPRGMGAGVQCEATSPAGILSKSQSFINMRRTCNPHEQARLKPSKSVNLLSASLPPSSPIGYYMDQLSHIREEVSPHSRWPSQYLTTDGQNHSRKSREQVSTETTLSVRKQSVRDLFHHYGIERPAGLVSEDAEEEARVLTGDKFCHVCLSVRVSKSKCMKCGHRYCETCKTMSPNAAMEEWLGRMANIHPLRHGCQPEDESNMIQFSSRQDLDSKATIPKDGPSGIHDSGANPSLKETRIQQTVHEPSWLHTGPARTKLATEISFKSSSNPRQQRTTCFEDSTLRRPRNSQSNFAQSPPRDQVNTKLASVLPQTATRHENELRVLAAKLPKHIDHNDINSGHDPHRSLHNIAHDGCRYHSDPPSNPQSENELSMEEYSFCDSSSCRATHAGHRPYRHSISCTKRRSESQAITNHGSFDKAVASYYHNQNLSSCKCKKHHPTKRKESLGTRLNDTDILSQPGKRSSQDTHLAAIHGRGAEHKRLGQDVRRDLPRHETLGQRRRSQSKVPSPRSYNSPPNITPTPAKTAIVPPLRNNDIKVIVQPPTRHGTFVSPEPEPKRTIQVQVSAIILAKNKSCHPPGPRSRFETAPLGNKQPKPKLPQAKPLPLFKEATPSPHPLGGYSEDTYSSEDDLTAKVTGVDYPLESRPEVSSLMSSLQSSDKTPTVASSDLIVSIPSVKSSSFSRRVSAFFKVQRRNSEPLLNKRLKEHQGELLRGQHAGYTPRLATRNTEDQKRASGVKHKKMQWQVNRKSRTPHRETPLPQDKLNDDEMSEGQREIPQHAVAGCVEESLAEQERQRDRDDDDKMGKEDANHDCRWKRMVVENEKIPDTARSSLRPDQVNYGILGVDVLIHLEGREDIILKASL